jgi:excisionase family DNA binding protein
MEDKKDPKQSPVLSAGEVAREFGVDPKTVTRWAKAGKLKSVRTLGGHRRFKREDIEAILGEFQ